MRDITRTFSNYKLFKHSKILSKMLKVAIAIHQKVPNLKYMQGLNFIIASLCLHCDETTAYWLFLELTDKLDLLDLFNDLDLLMEKVNEMGEEIMEYDLEIKHKLDKLKITPDIFITSWAMSLMAHAVPLEYSEVLWSVIFDQGWDGFIQVIQVCLDVLKPDILKCKDLKTFTNILSKLTKPSQNKQYAIEYYASDISLE